MINAQKMMIKNFMSHSNLRLYVSGNSGIKWAEFVEYNLQCITLDLTIYIHMWRQGDV